MPTISKRTVAMASLGVLAAAVTACSTSTPQAAGSAGSAGSAGQAGAPQAMTGAAPTSSTHPSPPAPPPPPPVVPVAGTPCNSKASACVDISKQEAWLIKDGKIAYGPVSVTTGRSGHRTPMGSFKVQWKDIDHRSKQFNNASMPYSVFFYPGDAFHTGSLSTLSHGCVHLSNSVAKRFYHFLSIGDGVQVRR